MASLISLRSGINRDGLGVVLFFDSNPAPPYSVGDPSTITITDQNGTPVTADVGFGFIDDLTMSGSWSTPAQMPGQTWNVSYGGGGIVDSNGDDIGGFGGSFTLPALTTYQSYLLSKLPLLYWPLGTDSFDFSSNGNSGNDTGTLAYNVSGTTVVDTSTAVETDDSGWIQSPDLGGPLDGAGALTLAVWINLASSGDVAFVGLCDTNGNRFEIAPYFGTTYAIIGNGSSPQQSTVTSLSGWHRYVLVFDGGLTSTSRGKLYVDGVLATSITCSNSTLPINMGTFSLGYEPANTRFSTIGTQWRDTVLCISAWSATDVANDYVGHLPTSGITSAGFFGAL